MKTIGLGCSNFTFAVYLANKPELAEFKNLGKIRPLIEGDIHSIGQSCGNGWRKIFNVYAKLIFALNNNSMVKFSANSWQSYRDTSLLRSKSKTALIFSPPKLDMESNEIHIIAGRTYCKSLFKNGNLRDNLIWLDKEFAIDKRNRLFVCPYFDYRQLSNRKIETLVGLLNDD